MSSCKWGFSDEPLNGYVNLFKIRVFSLDYVLRDLKMGENGLEIEDDMRSLELAIVVEEYLGFRI